MDRRQKVIFLTLWVILIVEWFGLLLLMYFARLPYFISLFIAFIQILSPWLLGVNAVFLLFTLFTRGLKFTWVSWRDYLKDFFRFFASSFAITVVLMTASSILGTALGISVERIWQLSIMNALREWVAYYFPPK
jgi:hypothetical protein